jgi:putative SbcD/Mre11-related phosphoesterase
MLAKTRLTLLHPHPALLVKEDSRQYLVLADLHIGFEEKFKLSGVKLCASTQNMLNEISQICAKHTVDEIILLGDLKFTIGRVSALERREIPPFLQHLSRLAKTTVIRGNHDGALSTILPREIILHSKPYLVVGDLCLLHGHTRLPELPSDVTKVVMGHIHPTYLREGSVIAGKHVWLLLKVKREALQSKQEGVIELYVLPPFNRELSFEGFAGRSGRIISPIIRRAVKAVCDAVILSLEGEIVGYSESLQYVI